MNNIKVSKKGQIVIPAKYRDRLDIKAGMEVKFSIRGQILQVEVVHDVVEDIKFLEDRGGKLGEADFDDAQMGEIINDLLSQQFYEGSDILTDRIGREKYKIRGADSIIQETIKILVHGGRYWLEGNYVKTFHEYAELFELDFASIVSNFNNKLKGMEMGGPSMISMMGGEVIFAMAIGEVLTQFRTRVGDETQERLIRETEILGYTEALGEETVEEIIIGGLAEKYSILMNLRVLRELARVSIKSLGSRRFEKIAENLLKEFEGKVMPDHIKKRIERRYKRASKRAKEMGIPFDQKPPLADVSDQQTSNEQEEEDIETDIPDLPSFDF
ncbi:MAG: AbrB/MazE/SpoVT family DNA-binding domain-containing protein [Candidatus Heimdallarchaeota archaeon]|nr:AbrB/MazE/SpoVT family DNA-binding domain-containing protein [Candidatus Heimdallarchaeota archaeon]